MDTIESNLRAELRRLVDLLDGGCTLPDGSNADTTAAHALLGDFRGPPCCICSESMDLSDMATGPASGPHGLILGADETAHRACLTDARGY